MSVSFELFAVLLFVLGYLVSPVMLISGWNRFAKCGWPRQVIPLAAFGSLVLATASALLALASSIYAHFHHFAFYDPLLMRIFRAGFLLSIGGLLLGMIGLWRPGPIRWQAAVSALGTAAFWVAAAAGE